MKSPGKLARYAAIIAVLLTSLMLLGCKDPSSPGGGAGGQPHKLADNGSGITDLLN